jgi:hypothetical protein
MKLLPPPKQYQKTYKVVTPGLQSAWVKDLPKFCIHYIPGQWIEQRIGSEGIFCFNRLSSAIMWSRSMLNTSTRILVCIGDEQVYNSVYTTYIKYLRTRSPSTVRKLTYKDHLQGLPHDTIRFRRIKPLYLLPKHLPSRYRVRILESKAQREKYLHLTND